MESSMGSIFAFIFYFLFLIYTQSSLSTVYFLSYSL